ADIDGRDDGALEQGVHRDGRQDSGARDYNDGYGQAFVSFDHASPPIQSTPVWMASRQYSKPASPGMSMVWLSSLGHHERDAPWPHDRAAMLRHPSLLRIQGKALNSEREVRAPWYRCHGHLRATVPAAAIDKTTPISIWGRQGSGGLSVRIGQDSVDRGDVRPTRDHGRRCVDGVVDDRRGETAQHTGQ